MKIIYKISTSEVKRIKAFYAKWSKDPFVVRRYERNILKQNGRMIKSQIWEAMISCLLITQQPSGPDSFVTKFINKRPFPLCLNDCVKKKNSAKYVTKAITEFGGLQYLFIAIKETNPHEAFDGLIVY